MKYWRENSDVLLKGEFIPSNPTANYPVIRGETENKTIIALYNDVIVKLDQKKKKKMPVHTLLEWM